MPESARLFLTVDPPARPRPAARKKLPCPLCAKYKKFVKLAQSNNAAQSVC